MTAEKVGLPASPPYLSVKNSNASSFLNGVSFTSGGAGIFDGNDDIYRQSVPLTKQVDYYSTVYQQLQQLLGSSAAQDTFSKSLFTVVIASNDISSYFGSSDLQKKSTPQEYVDWMAQTLIVQLKRMYEKGARKFVAAEVRLIGCCPAQRYKNNTQECNGQNFIQKPADYGFTEVKAACCGLGNLNAKVACLTISQYCSNRADHMFWDLYHPTQAAARMFVDEIFEGSSQYTSPINVKQLVTLQPAILRKGLEH